MPFCRLHHESRAGSVGTPETGHLTANGQLGRWEAALGNIEDARVALDMCAATQHANCASALTRLARNRHCIICVAAFVVSNLCILSPQAVAVG